MPNNADCGAILYGMRQTTLFLLLLLPLAFSAQTLEIDYPYNPDYDNTGNIGINDLLPMLTLFTQEFEAEGIMVDTLTLEDAFLMMMAQIIELQGQVEALQSAVIPGLSDHVSVEDDQTLLISGVNLQLVNGAGSTSAVNGLGNLIVGYNESDSLTTERGGSHNLVMGRWNQYGSFSGIAHGLRNSVLDAESAVIAGSNNVVSGVRSAVLGGDQNTASGNKVVAMGGVQNEAKGSVSVAMGGENNEVDGTACIALGGRNNAALGGHDVLVGGGNNVTSGDKSVLVGGQSNQTVMEEGGNAQYSAIFGGRFNQASDYCGSIFGGTSNSLSAGLNSPSNYSSQGKTIVGGTDNVNVADSYSTILGGSGLLLEPRDTATYYGGEAGFYGPSGDVGIGAAPGAYSNGVYLGNSANPLFIMVSPDDAGGMDE